MQTKLIKALMQRLLDAGGQDFELYLCCMLDENKELDARLVSELYLSLFPAGAGSLRDVANLRAIELGYTGIEDLLAYGKQSANYIFEG